MKKKYMIILVENELLFFGILNIFIIYRFMCRFNIFEMFVCKFIVSIYVIIEYYFE